jgi:peptide/nickel transport system substrate-binding protein
MIPQTSLSIQMIGWRLVGLALFLLVVLAACDTQREQSAADITPIATVPAVPTTDLPINRDRDLIVIATDAPFPPFTDFDLFGNVIGFNDAIVEAIAERTGLDYEFVVTPSQGVLDSIAAGSARDFDAVMSALIIPDEPPPGITFTVPYLEVGQVALVLVDNEEIQSIADIRPGMSAGVLAERAGLDAALAMGLPESDIYDSYDRPSQLIQALIDEVIDVVIVDSYTAQYFADNFPEQVRIAGDGDEGGWFSRKTYGIAVAADNTGLLETLNSAIVDLQQTGVIDQMTVTWLISETNAVAAVDPGESRVGTPAGELFIGVVGEFTDMDPASLTVDFISWEIKNNTMSGLYRFNAENVLEPLLAAELPTISEDKLEYTIPLRAGLEFPDGTDFSADDVKWSLNRAAGLGNFMVNNYLKDSNGDNFADEDAVQVIDPSTVKIILKEPTAYFPAILATPTYFPVSQECFGDAGNPGSTCGGLGPYTIVNWDLNNRLRLKSNPGWPGRPAPMFANITVKFFPDVESMRRSLVEFRSIDLAWTGLTFEDFIELTGQASGDENNANYAGWVGPSTFKSYIIFEQNTPPWDRAKIRQAAALSLDREALAREIFNDGRLPLLSPVPNDIPGHVESLPARNLDRARSLLLEEGYSESQKLPISLWFVNDGRYSPIEENYANGIKAQLEETRVFEVNVTGVPWNEFRIQIDQCGYSTYLLGWPSPGQPTTYLDASSWTDFFVTNTDRIFCSNYESPRMTTLIAESRAEVDPQARLELIERIQQLWAEELPTLDLTQAPRHAVSLSTVGNVRVNALGLMHYELLTKELAP